MKKTIIALTAVLMASGAAMADDFSGNLKYEAPAAQRTVNDRYGDAAPSVVVVNPRGFDFSGAASATQPGAREQTHWNSRYGDAAPPLVVVNPSARGY